MTLLPRTSSLQKDNVIAAKWPSFYVRVESIMAQLCQTAENSPPWRNRCQLSRCTQDILWVYWVERVISFHFLVSLDVHNSLTMCVKQIDGELTEIDTSSFLTYSQSQFSPFSMLGSVLRTRSFLLQIFRIWLQNFAVLTKVLSTGLQGRGH